MSINRFISSDLAREVIGKSTALEIRIHRINGKLCASFELSGSVGSDPFDEDDDDDGDLLKHPSANDEKDLRFIVDLLSEFERARR